MFCFAPCKLETAQRVVSGEIPISMALLPSDDKPGVYEVSDEPGVPHHADETILVLDFPKDTDLMVHEQELLDSSGRTFLLPAAILDSAKASITPLGIVEYLATQELHNPMLPEAILLWECISNTHPRERKELWGYSCPKPARNGRKERVNTCIGGVRLTLHESPPIFRS